LLRGNKKDAGQVYPPQAAPKATRAGMTEIDTNVFILIAALVTAKER
jgi:hypothetical protein